MKSLACWQSYLLCLILHKYYRRLCARFFFFSFLIHAHCDPFFIMLQSGCKPFSYSVGRGLGNGCPLFYSKQIGCTRGASCVRNSISYIEFFSSHVLTCVPSTVCRLTSVHSLVRCPDIVNTKCDTGPAVETHAYTLYILAILSLVRG